MAKTNKQSDQVTKGYVCPGPVTDEFSTFTGDPYINCEEIFWHLEGNLTKDFDEVKVVEAFRSAFSILQPYFYPIKFQSTSNFDKANLIIHFAENGDNDLPRQFPPHVLAYAFSPANDISNLWFDDSKNWADMHMPTFTEDGKKTYNLTSVAVHEILHSLGLRHSDPHAFPGDILNPTYQEGGRIEFKTDTIDGIDFLYGDMKDFINSKKKEEEEEQPSDKEGGDSNSKGCSLLAVLFGLFSTASIFSIF